MDLLLTFWQWTIFVILVLVGYVFTRFDGQGDYRVGFKMDEMPHMKPITIETKDKGFWKGIIMWMLSVRKWEICDDFYYTISDVEYMIPKGFQFDGASVPKFLAMWLSPTGVLLMGGLVHDYGYKYATLMTRDGNNIGYTNQAHMDKLFRDICIEVNGFKFLNYLAYWALAAVGFFAWNKHKKNGTHLDKVDE